tara:strand:+ start:5928 stop:6782 length:855 start_codon:yes stop_codon:yes gene_type:complete
VSRRNSGRTKGPQEEAEASGAPAPAPTSNDVFSFVTPTEFVELPSKGLYYNEDHPLHDCDVVEIRHMTAREEDILTSETLLKSGMALNRLLQSVLVDKRLHPDSLLIGDKNAVLIATRQTGFGDEYTTTINCNGCGHSNEKQFSLSSKTIKESNIPEGVTLLENGNFMYHNDDYDLELELHLLNGRDETRITKILEKSKKLKTEARSITTMLESIIVSVNDIKDSGAIRQVVSAMPVKLSRKLRSVYEEVMPNVGIYADFECDSCPHAEKLEVPISINFFWPDA